MYKSIKNKANYENITKCASLAFFQQWSPKIWSTVGGIFSCFVSFQERFCWLSISFAANIYTAGDEQKWSSRLLGSRSLLESKSQWVGCGFCLPVRWPISHFSVWPNSYTGLLQAKMQMSSCKTGLWALDSEFWTLADGQRTETKNVMQSMANFKRTESRASPDCVYYILFTKCKCCLQSLKLKQIYIYARQHIKTKNKTQKPEMQRHWREA